MICKDIFNAFLELFCVILGTEACYLVSILCWMFTRDMLKGDL